MKGEWKFMRDDKKLELVADLPNKLTGIPSKDRIWLKRSKRASVKMDSRRFFCSCIRRYG